MRTNKQPFSCFQSFKNSYLQLIKTQSCHHIETSQMIKANHLTVFYMAASFAFNELKDQQCAWFNVFHLMQKNPHWHQMNYTSNKTVSRSSHQRCFIKKDVLRNFTEFTGKHWSATLLKKRLWHRCFPVNSVKFLRTPFLQNTSWRLLLHFWSLLYNPNSIIFPAGNYLLEVNYRNTRTQVAKYVQI